MNSNSEIDQDSLVQIVRHADGGIDHDYYRNMARQQRSDAITQLIAALWRVIDGFRGKSARARMIETPWQPDAVSRRR